MTFRTALGSAELKTSRQDGNFLVIFILILLIAGAVAYYMMASDQVDSEYRKFGATQGVSYLKVDIQQTLRRTLLGTNSDCDATILTSMKKFRNLLTPQAQAQSNINLTSFTSPADLSIAHCFLRPESYPAAVMKKLKIKLYRTGAPNYVTLSSSVSADVNVKIEIAGRVTTEKFILRYRVEVLSLNHYGIIFDSDRSDDLFNIAEPEAKVKANANVLVDQRQPAFPRNGDYPLSLLIPANPGSLFFSKKVEVAAKSVTMDAESESFMKGEKTFISGERMRINDLFRRGVELNALSNLTGLAPYQQSTSTQWSDILNYEFLEADAYPIPKMRSGLSAIPVSGDIAFTFDKDKLNASFDVNAYKVSGAVSTAKIYEKLNGNKNMLYKSCSGADIGSSRYPLFIYNNFGEDSDASFNAGDLIIDFTGNLDPTAPPVFCGVIAAKNVTFILNDSTTNPKHQFFGKLFVKGKITVLGKGELEIYDLTDVTNDSVLYSVPNVEELQIQYFNQKFYATQNFQLPFFRTGTIYSVTSDASCGSDPFFTCARDRYYVPKALREFFRKDVSYVKNPPPNQMTGKTDGVVDCKNSGGAEFYCRTDSVVSPTPPEDLVTRWGNNVGTDDLLYEVFIAE